MSEIETTVYECCDHWGKGGLPKYLCWITQRAVVRDKNRKPTGEFKTVFLPVYFTGQSYDEAKDRAIAFWNDEKGKEAARKERGRKLGQSRKIPPLPNPIGGGR